MYLLRFLSFLIPIVAGLSFSIQPIIGKYLLPSQGGNISSWLVIMLFFQFSLLIGYVFSFILSKFKPTHQYFILPIIGVISIFTLNLNPSIDNTLSQFSLLFLLISNLLIPISLLFSYSIILQNWFTYKGKQIPYYLYALSNIGSLIGLCIYPFLIEPFYELNTQTTIWKDIYIGIIILISTISIIFIKNPGHKENNSINLNYKDIFLWILVSIIPCSIFLEVTRLLGLEWGSHPFTWTVPLGIYLLMFSLIFSSKDYTINKINHYFYPLAIGLLLFTIFGSVIQKPLNIPAQIGLGLLVLGGLCGGLRILYHTRPKDPSLISIYYICIGLGGVISGLISSIIAPIILTRPIEIILLCLSLCLIWNYKFKPLRIKYFNIIYPSIIILSMIGLYTIEKINSNIKYYRSNFSTYIVDTNPKDNYKYIKSGHTVHGVQYDNDITPTSYYWTESPIGLLMKYFKEEFPKGYNISVVGLGVGVLSSYNRDFDTIKYYEIDPLVEIIAKEEFTFLSSSKGTNEVIIEDGRIGIKNSKMSDLIVIDAFSGDGIPLYLLTKEAINDYITKSNTGLILLHISNQYWDLRPIIKGSALQNNLNYMIIDNVSISSKSFLKTNSRYAIIYKDKSSKFVDKFVKFATENSNDISIYTIDNAIEWTDSKYSILNVPRL